MASEPRKCLFNTQNVDGSPKSQKSPGKELDSILMKTYNEFISKYYLDNRAAGTAEAGRMKWNEEEKENLPEFYSRDPKRKVMTVKKSVNGNTEEANLNLSPLRRKLEELKLQKSSQQSQQPPLSPNSGRNMQPKSL